MIVSMSVDCVDSDTTDVSVMLSVVSSLMVCVEESAVTNVLVLVV